MKRKTVLTAGAVVVLALVVYKIAFRGESKAPERSGGGQRDQAIEVKGVVARYENVSERVATVGTVLSNEEAEIRSEVSGKIERIHFSEGSNVGAGDLLVKIVDDELRAQFRQAEARLSLAKQQEERQRQLREKNLASDQEYETASTQLRLAEAEVELVSARLKKTEIRAPFHGTIGLRYVSEGSYVTPSALISTLQDKGTVKIDFAVPEKYAPMVEKGDKITFSIQGNQDSFEGRIYAIDPKIDPAARTLRLRATSLNRSGALLPGSLASVTISFREKKAIMAPSFALIPDLQGHKVFISSRGKAAARIVRIGMRTEDRVEILDGISEGDTILVSGLLQLRPDLGVRVSVSDSTKAPNP